MLKKIGRELLFIFAAAIAALIFVLGFSLLFFYLPGPYESCAANIEREDCGWYRKKIAEEKQSEADYEKLEKWIRGIVGAD